MFAPEAEGQLANLYNYLAKEATPETALRYTENIVSFCESLDRFPHRGNRRDDLLPGLRITNYRKRTIIAFIVESGTVTVAGIWHGGQDYENDESPDAIDES